MPEFQLVDVQHNVRLFAQPTGMTCWSAATTMLLGDKFCAGPGKAAVGATGGLKSDLNNVFSFAESYGLQVHAPQSWTIEGLVKLVQKRPVMMMGVMPELHAVVIGGIRSDGTAIGTILTIYDPWPEGIGKVHPAVNWQHFIDAYPLATMYMLHD